MRSDSLMRCCATSPTRESRVGPLPVARADRQVAGQPHGHTGLRVRRNHRLPPRTSLPVAHRLGPTSDTAQALGLEASARLDSAAARAFASEDMLSTVSLLSRAVALLPDKDRDRLALLPRLAFALIETGDFRRLARVIEETSLPADAIDDEQALALAGVLEQWMRLYTDPNRRPAQARDAVHEALSTFEAIGDDYGLAKAWSLLGFANNVSARFADAETAWAQAAVHAHLGLANDETNSTHSPGG